MNKKGSFLALLLLTFHQFYQVGSVVASEWSLAGPVDEHVMANINMTYINASTGKREDGEYGGEIGKFGVGKVVSATGIVLHVKSKTSSGEINHFGCESLEGPFPDRPWIALIKRGSCNFDKKLEHSQAKNAIAMVVYDLEDRDTLEKMGLSNCKNCTIPGIFIRKRVGEAIINASNNGWIVEMQIGIGETYTRPYSGINRTSVLFVSVSFIILMIISLAWLVFYYIQRFRYLHAKDRLAQRLCNAAKKALAKIPTRNVKLSDKEVSGELDCCAVCIEFYASGDVLRTLPCRHEFHKSCVDPWLLEHRTCPMCKMDILKHYGYIFTGSQESILHLDLEDGNLNSSDSRESETPTQPHSIRYAEVTDQPQLQQQRRSINENPSHSSQSSHCPHHQNQDSRKPSLISLTVVANRNGQVSNQPEYNISPTSGNSYTFTTCKCRCSCDKPIPIAEFQPVCYVHEDADGNGEDGESSHHSLEDSSSEVGVGSNNIPSSHRPLIHREDSGILQINRSQSVSSNLHEEKEMDAKKCLSRSESQSRVQDLSKSKTGTPSPKQESISNPSMV